MTIKTSVETIGGKLFTVVWYEEIIGYAADNLGEFPHVETEIGSLEFCTIYKANYSICEHIATALPALPRHPKNDEETIRLLHLYRAHGIVVNMEWDNNLMAMLGEPENAEILSATDTAGNKLEIAIEG